MTIQELYEAIKQNVTEAKIIGSELLKQGEQRKVDQINELAKKKTFVDVFKLLDRRTFPIKSEMQRIHTLSKMLLKEVKIIQKVK